MWPKWRCREINDCWGIISRPHGQPELMAGLMITFPIRGKVRLGEIKLSNNLSICFNNMLHIPIDIVLMFKLSTQIGGHFVEGESTRRAKESDKHTRASEREGGRERDRERERWRVSEREKREAEKGERVLNRM